MYCRQLILLLFILFSGHASVWAQKNKSVGASPGKIKQHFTSPCEEASSFIPYHPTYHPVKTLRIAFHVFQKNDGSENFQNTPEDRAILQSFIEDVNRRYAHLAPHDPPVNSEYIEDSRIRFSLERIYFYQDSLAWNMDDDGPCGPYTPCGQKLYKQYVTENKQLSGDEKEHMLHIFLGESPGFRYATGGAASGIGSKKYIRSRGYYWYYHQHPHQAWAREYIKGNIAHELGHCLGLTHTFEGGTCTRFNDPPRTDKNQPSNNIMDYGAWTSLTACQLGLIHYSIFRDRGNLRDIWVKDYLVLQPEETVVIRRGEEVVWESPRYLKGNVIIEKGAKLTLRCQLGMPPESEVIINEGGWLLVDKGAELVGTENKTWKGIRAARANVWIKLYKRNGAPWNFGLLQVAEGGVIRLSGEKEF